ncbi:MAG: polysaccharide biosynthesis protein PslH [Acidobacteriota bacterium]|jgi:glycosyltransferase involved in cell wall biosynthesis|nr:polysaccharide biosynthesis protein PslH [Acidobacteriota bacterium]
MRILWLKTELLHPVDKGGKIRTYQTLKELKREHHITYLTLDDGTAGEDARERASEYCHELVCVPHRTSQKFSAAFYLELARNLFSRLPYFMKKYESSEMRREIIERTPQGNYDVLVCDSLQPSINIPSSTGMPMVLTQHNVEAMIWQRHYEVQRNQLKKVFFYGQWRKAVAYERAASQRFDKIIAVSREDAEVTRRDFGVETVEDAPTGVDTDFFRPSGGIEREPHNLVFTGSMDWLPNEDAIQFFTREVLPLVKKTIPDVTLTVVGRNPFPSLIELGRRDPSIVVTGRVEDVRPYMEKAAAYIVPLRIGGGTRLKIYEAMAMEKPVISTTIGAEGLPVRDGAELLLADTPEAFAEAIVRVLTDEEFARELARRAAETVRAEFGWDKVAAVVAEICERTVRASGQWSVVSGQLPVEKAVPTDH